MQLQTQLSVSCAWGKPACNVRYLFPIPMKGISIMSRMKSVFAIAVLIAVAGAVQTANAQATFKTLIIGASGSFNAVAVGAYNAGKCPNNVTAGTCGHASFGTTTAVNVVDTRGSSKTGGGNITDTGATIWVVWDHAVSGSGGCTATCNVWAYVKVDSVVGNRCFFATPRCQIQITSVGTPENKVPTVTGAWPNEGGIVVPTNVATLLTSNPRVNVAASEVRPEDAAFANCRVNSQLGGGNDSLAGLGYNTNNAPGVCPTFATSTSIGPYVGTDLTSAFSGTTAHPVAFNIAGNDPITNSAIPGFTTVDIGAVPVIFIVDHEDASGLANVSNVTIDQLQKVFSGTSCLASDLGGGADPINVFQREPLSGTMQAAEYTVFRLPRDSSGNYDTTNGASQEKGIGGINPVNNLPCGAGGGRYRAVGNGDETSAIQNSFATNGNDGIGYMFFSYANVAKLINNAKYRYLAVNGVDPIFQVYNSTYDSAQPAGAGALPAAANLPASCGTAGTFPCAETHIWKGLWSFPNVRNGSYRHWIMIRLIGATGSAPLTAAQALVTAAQAGAVTQVPDFVPALETIAGGIDDPGLKLRHSHYTQNSPGYTHAPHNRTDGGGTEAGGDVGGCLTINASTATSLVYREKTNCTVGP
jgi:hypothetical protein